MEDDTGTLESAPETDPVDSRDAAAEMIRDLRSSFGQDEPAKEPAKEAEPAKPEAKEEPQEPPAPSWLDAERDLQAKIEAKRAEQAQQRQAAQQSESEAKAAARERDFEAKIAEFERDPVAYYEKHGRDPRPAFQRFTQIAAKGGAAKVETTVESLQAKIAELEERIANPKIADVDEIKQWRADQERQRAESAFIEHASSQEAYPLLSRLPPDSRVELAHETAARFRAAGMDFDLATVARHAEGRLRHQFELLGGQPSTAQAAQPKSGDVAARAPSSGPTAITNAAASDSSGTPREPTDEERRELAAQDLRRAMRGEAVSA